ncbi:MAG: hypothetical protein KGL65_08865, partial [Rhodospirillales bacterium]|nr:hypothetical protein [Rhodospirillales bacterium]
MNITFIMTERRRINEARREWAKQRSGGGAYIDFMPALHGPDVAGSMTMYSVEEDFVEFLRTKGIQFR